MKKLLVVGVIVLFLGLACAPSINANVSKESELVEITTEICGLGGGKHTVQLTKDEAKEVEQLIDDIERRLDEVETREEAEEIFNEAVVELDEYGLLGGLSVKQAQRLVTGRFQRYNAMRLFANVSELVDTNQNGMKNTFCLIAGLSSETVFFGLLARFLSFNFVYVFHPETLFGILIWFYILMNFVGIDLIRPIIWGSLIAYCWDYNTQGWISTVGLQGIKSVNGSFEGVIDLLCLGYIGVAGFNGIKVLLDIGEKVSFYLGFALRVNIECINE